MGESGRNFGKRTIGAKAPSSFSAAEERAAMTRAIQNVVRRLGVVLNAALDASISQLLQAEALDTAGVLRDELKPLCDALIHFEVHDEEVSEG